MGAALECMVYLVTCRVKVSVRAWVRISVRVRVRVSDSFSWQHVGCAGGAFALCSGTCETHYDDYNITH